MPPGLLRWVLVALHRVRSRGPSVLATMAVMVLLAGSPAFVHEASVRGGSISWHEGLYWTLGLFTFTNNPFNYAVTWPLRTLYFVAPLLAASALLGAIIHMLEQRAPLFARSFRRHTVIGGLGNLGSALTEEFKKQGSPFVCIERRDDTAAGDLLRATGDALVITGDISNIETLRNARCDRATRVFFTAASDVVNLDAAFTVRRIARHARMRHPPTVYAHVFDIALSDAIESQLRPRRSRDAVIIPFNAYRIAAKALVASLVRDRVVCSHRVAPGVALLRTRWPQVADDAREIETRDVHKILEDDRGRLTKAFTLGPEPRDAVPDRYVIVGVGRFGASVVRELLNTVPENTRFLVFERSAETLARFLPTLREDELSRFETRREDAEHSAKTDILSRYNPTAVLICSDDDITNLRLALELRRRGVRVVTRLFGLDATGELVRGLDEYGVSPVGLARLFRAAIPILTHAQKLRACINLDFARTPEVDHLFYLARVTAEERTRLGNACVPLSALPRTGDVTVPEDIALVWHQHVPLLDPEVGPEDDMSQNSMLVDINRLSRPSAGTSVFLPLNSLRPPSE